MGSTKRRARQQSLKAPVGTSAGQVILLGLPLLILSACGVRGGSSIPDRQQQPGGALAASLALQEAQLPAPQDVAARDRVARAILRANSLTLSGPEGPVVTEGKPDKLGKPELPKSWGIAAVEKIQPLLRDDDWTKRADRYIGQIQTFVVHGTRERKNFPSCVAVGRPGSWGFSGTLIAKNAVLTAAHADIYDGDGTILVGTSDVSVGGQVYTGKFVRAPGSNISPLHCDVAVIVLDTDVTEVTPCLLATREEIAEVEVGTVVGYGNTWSTGEGTGGAGCRCSGVVVLCACSATLQKPTSCYLDEEIVAANPLKPQDGGGNGADSCFGDSGGPLYVHCSSGGWHIAGVTSRGYDARPSGLMCRDGSVYGLVPYHETWIRSVPGIHW